MKKICFIAACFCGLNLSAQESFFPAKEGAELQYAYYDKKGNISNTLQYTVAKVNKSENNVAITYRSELFSTGNKPKSLRKKEIVVEQEGDTLYLDMSDYVYLEDLTYVLPGLTGTMGGQGSSGPQKVGGGTVTGTASFSKDVTFKKATLPDEAAITGGKMGMPLNPATGGFLADANLSMKVKGSIKTSFINQEYTLRTTNRLVEKEEDINVHAGDFHCYKITCEIHLANISKIKTAKGASEVTVYKTYWYAPGVGLVKMEETDENGKLVSRMELLETKNL